MEVLAIALFPARSKLQTRGLYQFRTLAIMREDPSGLANVASWSANSVFTANASHLHVRAPTLSADTIDCQMCF